MICGMTKEQFYRDLSEVMEVGEEQDFQPQVEFRKLAWWDSLMYLRLLDFMETATGGVFPHTELEKVNTWEELASHTDKTSNS